MASTNSDLGIGLQRIIKILIQRCGSLRGASNFTGISRTAFSKLRDGETLYPESYTLQKMEVALKKLNPPLTDPETGETLLYTWVELDLIAENQRQQLGVSLKSRLEKQDTSKNETEEIKHQIADMQKQIDFLSQKLNEKKIRVDSCDLDKAMLMAK
jgi:flagellar capping protein FliD